MEEQNRAKVEEVLQKFCQISMLAVSKRDVSVNYDIPTFDVFVRLHPSPWMLFC